MDTTRRVLVVGASAAGLRCAARLARLSPEARVTVIEQAERFSYAACGLPYVLSGDVDDSSELLQTVYGVVRDTDYFAQVKGVEVRAGWRATAVDVEGRTLTIQRGESTELLEWDELVLATGAHPRRLAVQPDHPRVQAFHVLDDLGPLQSGLMRGAIDHAVVVGAGLVGCEIAEAFHALWGAEVTLLEAAPWPLPQVLDREMGAAVAAALAGAGVTVHTGVSVDGIVAEDDGVRVTAGDLTDHFRRCGGGCGRGSGGEPGRAGWRRDRTRWAVSWWTNGWPPRYPMSGRPVTASR